MMPVLRELKNKRTLYIMLLPAVFYFMIFSYLPMTGIVLAFKSLRYDTGIFGSAWVGWTNFNFFFKSGQAWLVTANTFLYNLAFIVTGMVLQISIAIVFSEMGGKKLKKILHSAMFIPYFMSWVVVGAFIYNIFNYEFGFFNTMLKALNLEPVDFYSNTQLWKYIIVFFNNWKYVGYYSIIYVAAISSIDLNIYESADIDGAGIFQKIRHITLPMLVPTMVIMILLSIGNIFRGNFDLFYQIVGNNGLLYNATDVIDTFVFRSLMQTQEVGMAAAAGLYQSVLCFAIILATNYIVKKINNDAGLF